MSRNRQRHKQERKRRHKRQIAEGTRQVRQKTKKNFYNKPMRRVVKLSELNREDVKKILDIIRNLIIYP